jgi:hypothetical protein
MTEPVRPLEALKQAEEHLTNLRLELNDWVPCSTQEQLARWRDIQQRLINCAKVVGVLQAAAPPAPTAEAVATPEPHGPVSERFMRHHYGASGVTVWPPERSDD